MEKISTVSETNKEFDLDFKMYHSKTWGIRVGCGTVYIVIDFNPDKTIHKVRIPRNTKFKCSLMTRDALAKQATFLGRRDPKQLIKDLKGSKAHCCENYNITCKAYSCSDAMAKVINAISSEVV